MPVMPPKLVKKKFQCFMKEKSHQVKEANFLESLTFVQLLETRDDSRFSSLQGIVMHDKMIVISDPTSEHEESPCIARSPRPRPVRYLHPQQVCGCSQQSLRRGL